jgi:hypothetical protein
VARRKGDDMLTPAVEKWIGADQESADAQLDCGRKCRIEFSFTRSLQDASLSA